MSVQTPTPPPMTGGPSPAPTPPPRDRSLRIALLAIGSALVLLLVGVGMLQLVQSAANANRGDDSGSYPAAGPFDSLEVDVSAASVTVSYADVAEPRFDFDSGGSSLRFDQRMLGDTLRVTVGDRGWWPIRLFDLSSLGDASLAVTLPRSAEPVALAVDSSAGAVRVDGDFAALSLESSAGDVELSGSADSLHLETSAGRITGTGLVVTGPVVSESSAGDTSLSFASLPASISVDSSAGSVTVALPDGEYELRTDTSFGRVQLGVPSTPGADRVYSFETSAGDLVLTPAP
ncbi:DUF4097 family beta strand repeat protein [Herbiconiux sp. VKM Ac-1786]|uniref:DUF4097 family beta strand repeat-containing protein n=1 Tax=Herbiconiux sp. VKM Ac-1786 TaxID=2783824 RepID=UPI00188D74B7|nr:DUF4097 family beta strand repeat-containing protein [Herbiconiux sp. VKM Ac-1786]MBF4572127.1 DUF4097 family beta strand repeat protein [Herbiconiux sp. VKM Ac-1786]